jgi:hypothetical protein
MSVYVGINLAMVSKEFIKLYEKKGFLSTKEMMEFLDKNKLKYIAHGGTRVVAAVNDNYVVKIALNSDYKAVNRAEYSRYKHMDEQERVHFTEMFRRGKDYSYLLVERVIPNIGKNQKDVPTEIQNIIYDNWGFNFGRRKNGEWVALDFADSWGS